MDKNNARTLISFSLAIAVIFLATAIFYAYRADKYRQKLLLAGENALSQLIYSAETMEEQLNILSKSGSGAALTEAASELWSASQSALTALATLDIAEGGMPRCEALLNQAGEYSRALMLSDAEGRQITETQSRDLAAISRDIGCICAALQQVKEDLDSGTLGLQKDGGLDNISLISEALGKIESDYSKAYSLVYDGSYSDHIAKVSPKHLENMDRISADGATKIAARFLGVSSADIKQLYETEGTIPVYGLQHGDRIVEVSRTGGMIVSVHAERYVHANLINQDDARQIALQAAQELGYQNLRCRYTSESANILTCELVGTNGEVTVYPDRVTVRVALDNGEVIGFDGQKYLMSNTSRTLTLPENLPDGASLALLPTDGQYERLCYEYLEDGHLRYVCAETDTCYAIHPFGEGEQQGLID